MVQADRQALVALYVATGVANWTKRSEWEMGTDLSQWHGVKVNHQGRAVQLHWSAIFLRGVIPTEVGNLAALEELDLRLNKLSGRIPKELGALRKLAMLDLSNNKLTGPIPLELGNLAALKKLSLSGNQLSGSIPESLGQLNKLETLHLNDNDFRGPIPLELRNLAALQYLALGDNWLSGEIPASLGQLRSLQKLDLHSNKLSGPIPPELGNLAALQYMNLSSNELSGEIPSSLGQLSELQTLNFWSNKLSGSIPPELGNLAALTAIGLRQNQLGGSIPPELGNLAALQHANLSSNELSGAVPLELGNLAALTYLSLADNQLNGIYKGTAQALKDLQKKRGNRLIIQLLPGNQWRHPHEAIVQGGLGNIVEFWEAIERSGAAQSWKLKVVLVGAVRAGKTSLARGMVFGEPRLCDEDDRTKGVDVHLDEPCTHDASSKLKLVFWDFAGHSEYYSTHQLFLSEGALHLLVVDLKRFSENPSERGDLVGIWLDALQCRVPGAKVLVVANKFDGWTGDHGTSLGELWRAVTGHLKAKRAELESARQHSSTRLEMPPNVIGFEVVSAADAESLVGLRGKVVALASRQDLFPSLGQVVPVSWARVRAVLEAKRSGKDPHSEASRIGADAEGFPAAPGRSGVAVNFLRWKDGVREWERVVRALKLEQEIGMTPWDHFLRAINFPGGEGLTKAETVFKSAVGLLMREGTIMWSGETLYVDPTWINELLRAILDHELTDETKANFWEREIKTFARDRAGNEYLELKKVHDNFCSTGTLTAGYLRFLWRNALGIGDEDIFANVLATMSHHGIIFRGAPARTGNEDSESELDDDSKLFVPVRLPSNILTSNLAECETLRRYQYRKELIYNMSQSHVPPGALGLMMARFLSLEDVELNACWSRGAAFAMGGPEVLMYLNNSREGASDKADITVQVFGQELSGELHNAVMRVQETIENVFAAHFSGLFVALQRGHPRPVRGADAGLERIDSLQAHISRLAAQVGDLRDKLNIRLSGLGALLDSMKGESMEGVEQVQSVLNDFRLHIQDNEGRRDMPSEVSMRLSSLESLVESNDGVMGRLDFLVGMLMMERAEKITAPRFACVLPPWNFALSHGLSSEEMDPREWTKQFAAWREDGFRDGKRIFKTEMRIFPVCAFSQELVPCGDNGQGYSVTRAREWVRTIASVAEALITMGLPAVEWAPVAAAAGGAAQETVKYAAKDAQPGSGAQYAGRLRNERFGKEGLEQVQELEGRDYDSLR